MKNPIARPINDCLSKRVKKPEGLMQGELPTWTTGGGEERSRGGRRGSLMCGWRYVPTYLG
jgi:hypothetical protein